MSEEDEKNESLAGIDERKTICKNCGIFKRDCDAKPNSKCCPDCHHSESTE